VLDGEQSIADTTKADAEVRRQADDRANFDAERNAFT